MEAGPKRTEQHWRLESPVGGGVRSVVDTADTAEAAAGAGSEVERDSFTEIL